MNDDVETHDELASVESWRLHQLLAADYPVELAEQLARAPHVDLRQAVGLRDRGCAAATAVKILL